MNENAALFFVDRNVNGSLKDKTAFIEYGNSSNSISYYDLYDQSSRLKNLFLKYNISREDRVIILMNDVVQYPVIFWGCLKSGVIPVLLNTLLSNEIINEINVNAIKDDKISIFITLILSVRAKANGCVI